MAKTGINFERANVASAEKHNKRDKGYIKAVNESPNKKYDIFNDRSDMNVFWENPKYAGKTLAKLLDEMRAIYREKVKQEPQEEDRVRKITDKKTGMKKEVVTPGWAPIREGVCPIKEDTSIKDFDQFVKWLESKGPKVIGIYLHVDEGHTDLVSGERKYNYHGHILVDWVNHETGKTYKLSKTDASEMQTQIALSLGMERGDSKELTGADHLRPDEYRAKAIAEDVIKLTKLRTEVTDGLRESCTALQEIGKETVRSLDDIIQAGAGAVKPTEEEATNRDRLEEEAKESIKNLELDALQKKTTTMRTLIKATTSAIDRIGTELRKLAAKIPDKKFHLFSSTSQKAQILAVEAEKEAEVVKVRAEAESAVKQAETAKNEAMRKARETENTAQKQIKEAQNREKAAKEEKEKYNEMNASLEKQIAEAKEKGRSAGYQDGYSAGEAAERAKTQAKEKEIDDLRASHAAKIEKMKKNLTLEKHWKEYFRMTSPLLENAESNYSELLRLKEWPLTKDEILRIFSGETVEKTHCKLPVHIALAIADDGTTKVVYNGTTKEECLQQLKQLAVKPTRPKGRTM